MLDYMRTMANGIAAVEAVADHVVEVAAELDADGQSGAADVLRMLARNHRVRSLELQCQLAALGGDYIALRQDTAGWM
ncbi:hypothetical protein [Methylobacterium sp. 17Sr1-1]|uniref:hypothetical protein n=1 Tax=Methylobacterium sp. 17Sr1-1 TaxID=2202826 RepID=UPI000D6F6ED9|nr:hypothetical protein [Methylobacterium sp. 17Sr1-1]AWN54412.1 hypothetical protein DK412_24635 [Methylobacterium sp. 17Sr1-1]